MALVTFTFTVLTLLSIQMVSGVRFDGPSGGGAPSDPLSGFGHEVTAEQQDVFSRSSPLAQAQILQNRREKALTQGANCGGESC